LKTTARPRDSSCCRLVFSGFESPFAHDSSCLRGSFFVFGASAQGIALIRGSGSVIVRLASRTCSGLACVRLGDVDVVHRLVDPLVAHAREALTPRTSEGSLLRWRFLFASPDAPGSADRLRPACPGLVRRRPPTGRRLCSRTATRPGLRRSPSRVTILARHTRCARIRTDRFRAQSVRNVSGVRPLTGQRRCWRPGTSTPVGSPYD
jgi:hypothetical protein